MMFRFHSLMIQPLFRGCSYDPTYRDVLPTETNIYVRSYEIFRPACRVSRDEITVVPQLAYATFQSSNTNLILAILVFFFVYLEEKVLL
jgi:hypothetical protein